MKKRHRPMVKQRSYKTGSNKSNSVIVVYTKGLLTKSNGVNAEKWRPQDHKCRGQRSPVEDYVGHNGEL